MNERHNYSIMQISSKNLIINLKYITSIADQCSRCIWVNLNYLFITKYKSKYTEARSALNNY